MDQKAQCLNLALLLLAGKLFKTLTSHISIMMPNKMTGVQWPVQCHTGDVITLWYLWVDGVSRRSRYIQVLGPVMCRAEARGSWELIFRPRLSILDPVCLA